VVAVKVWLAGEGPSEIGDRDSGGERVGVLEALLRRIEAAGWVVDRATRWKHIRKFEAGRALRGAGDDRSVQRLVLHAYEAGCEVVAFSRDRDSDPDREATLERGIEAASRDYPGVGVIGGIARPSIEGWVLALAGTKDTDEMSRPRCDRELELHSIQMGHDAVAAFVAIVERADLGSLPDGCDSLVTWLERARAVLPRTIHGSAVDPGARGGA
jgi:hypothetical protein